MLCLLQIGADITKPRKWLQNGAVQGTSYESYEFRNWNA